MKTKIIVSTYLILSFLCSCEKDKNDSEEKITKEKLTGYVQKGPYINGTSITMYELDSDLKQTGKSFSSQIIDNKGTFEIENIELSSKYVEFKADGFYYNEVIGENSSAQLTLSAISNIENKNNINVNILTHLEKERIEHLITTGISFDSAKIQASQEVLQIFNITKSDVSSSELLDISQPEDDNAILLAISIIIQGYRTESDLTELLANISTDIKEDGILDNSIFGSSLVNDISYIDLELVRENLENKYLFLGVSTTIPDFEKYVKLFKDSADFELTNKITYPIEGKYGINILNETDSILIVGDYSMAAELPSGMSLKVMFNKDREGNLAFSIGQQDTGWEDLDSDETGEWRSLKTYRTGNVDMKMMFFDEVIIHIFENEAEEPTRTKILYKAN